MEPSLACWARTADEANRKIAAGFTNFISSPEDFILHHSAMRFLCGAGQTYHVTDVSKGAMTVQKAAVDRAARYRRWTELLREELRLVAKPHAHLIAVGADVSGVLSAMALNRQITRVIHYSALASSARNAAVQGREAEFEAFSDAFSPSDVIAVAAQIMRENGVPPRFSEETLARLRAANWTQSRRKLAFVYATAFETSRSRGTISGATLPSPA